MGGWMRFLRTTVLLLAVAAVANACSQSPPTDHGDSDWWSTAVETLKDEQKAEYDRQQENGHDDAWMLTAPGPPATDADVSAAEDRLGIRFDEQYKEWLHYVNGWRFYCGGDSLYSLKDVAQDSPKRRNLLTWLDSAELTPKDLGVDSFDDLLVIGGADGAYFIATTASEQKRDVAPILEFGGGVVTHANLKAYIQANIDIARNRVNNPW